MTRCYRIRGRSAVADVVEEGLVRLRFTGVVYLARIHPLRSALFSFYGSTTVHARAMRGLQYVVEHTFPRRVPHGHATHGGVSFFWWRSPRRGVR